MDGPAALRRRCFLPTPPLTVPPRGGTATEVEPLPRRREPRSTCFKWTQSPSLPIIPADRFFRRREFTLPSAALGRWQNDRMLRLGHMDAHCASLFAVPTAPLPPQPTPSGPHQPVVPVPVAVAPPPPPPLAHESLQGYVVLLSGHFQGFCRNLYTECAQLCAAAAPATLRTTIQAQFVSGLALNDVQAWRASCDGLANSLDAIMRGELTRILGAAPW